MTAQSEKAKDFARLHMAKEGFVMPNPWDVGSTRIMAHHGFKALATSSAAFANTLGRGDYKVSRDEALQHCRDIAGATDLPVSADLEKCFADKPEDVADVILRATDTGIVGCSIEDATGDLQEPLFPFEMAVDRVRLAVKAAERVSFPFTITARTEALLFGEKDIKEIIRRLQAFEKAGAHVLFAPGITSIDQAQQITAAVRRPVNVMAMKMLSAPDLFEVGVKRVSLGPWFARAAVQALLEAIDEVKTKGTFTFAEKCPNGGQIAKMLES
jgi:2-methylisocitrate lyase-like PEP mutase family enzyme